MRKFDELNFTSSSRFLQGLSFVAWLCLTNVPEAVEIQPGELSQAKRWADAKFQARISEPARDPALVVVANHDPVQKNSRNGKPMRIGGENFTRGLYCHAPSKIIVRLPQPGKTFGAIIGVDSNEQTSGGRGSVEFLVKVGDKEVFRSGTMRENTAAKQLQVELNGAKEFVLQVGETPDGIACDQSDWANARITLQDGSELWLSDLPLIDGERAAYSTEPPFSFIYDGKPSSSLLKEWKAERTFRQIDAQRMERTITWSGSGGLQVRCVSVEYADYPTVEWTLHFKNTGQTDSPVLSDILSIDTTFDRGGAGEFLLHHHKGTFVRADDFEPLSTTLEPGKTVRFAPPGGRPLGHVFPYFNLQQQPDEGVIVVVGWPGQWFAEFARDKARGLHIVAGQEKLRVSLKPGEEIRSPLMVAQFWQGGDWVRAQNVWRRWMLAYNVPRVGGKPLGPQMAACSSHQFAEMINANEENQIQFVDRYLEEKLPLDYWWMDAGWYYHFGGGWPRTGTWEVDKDRFPHGLRSITDHARQRGVKSIVWFEPERVTPGTFLYTNNPAWLLGKDGDQKLLNLGHPDALRWLIGHVSNLIREQGIDLYRQDYNIDPLGYWRGSDTPDRQGVTENHYVTGYLAFWDALLHAFPSLVIDTCASGGHRNDLETLRRSVPLLRSDYILEPVGQQCHSYGLAFWVPFHGTGINTMDPYVFRSQICPHVTACYDMRRTDLPYEDARRLLAQWKTDIAPNYWGDFYPLTGCTTANDAWMAWQFDRPEEGQGLVQVFRRASSIYEAARLKLHALDPKARYSVTDLDQPTSLRELTGRELLERGLLVNAPQQPAAMVFTYRLIK
jgi:alpha-galactosidase